jgi:hypothetical protein
MAIELGLLGPKPEEPEVTDLDGVYQALAARGYDAAVFAVDTTLPKEQLGKASPDHDAVVLVTNTENGVQKRYATTPASTWAETFLADVHKGEFGPPPKGVPFAGVVPHHK